MKKRKSNAPANLLSRPEIENELMKIGAGIKSERKARTALERLSFEIKLAKTTLIKCEAGNDMLLSTFLRILYGLGIPPKQFFASINKSHGRNRGLTNL